jgi:S-adenosylmethionine synthetase
VLKVEKFLNSKRFKKEFPESGEDIKVMALRSNDNLHLTISMAFVDRFVDSEQTYFKKKEEILQAIKEFVKINSNFKNIDLYLNTLDERGRGVSGIYLTVLGTCADSADSGQVGRGNRINGVISLSRPASEEAAAGKNPVSHVGKIYNLLSFRIAEKVYQKVDGLKEVYIWMLSQIGRPIDNPLIAAAQLILDKKNSFPSIQKKVREVIDYELENINNFTKELAKGKIPVC